MYRARIGLLPGDDPDVSDPVRKGLDPAMAACADQYEHMVWKPLGRLEYQFQPFLVIDASRIDDRLGPAFDTDLPLRDLRRDPSAQTLRIEAVVNAVQLLRRDRQLEILSPGVLRMADVGEKAGMAGYVVNPAT